MRALALLTALACAGCAGPQATDDDPPGPTATPADTAPPTVEIVYQAWEEDRQCWSIRRLERDAAVWSDWVDNYCEVSIERDVVYWIADGHCGRFGMALEDSCAVSDFGSWVQDCDPLAHSHSCCTYNRIQCDPPYYEP